MARFPHLHNTSDRFPDLETVNAYKFNGDFDYSEFDNPQMNITLCRVPWDMGEVHIGNRTVSGIGNVVHFGTKAKRDKWFNDIPDNECIRFSTEYRRLHTDNYLDIELPFDIAATYNYIAVEYPEIDVKWEQTGGYKRWFWFVREVERIANNTTRLHILPDSWQTFIYDFPIKSMMLERGHLPVFKQLADTYLSDPVNNSDWLLADDDSFDSPRIARKSSEFLITGSNAVAVIVASAVPTADFGTKAADTWHTPDGPCIQHGVPSYHAFYVATSQVNTFLNNMNAQVPQFGQCIKAVFFVNRELVYSGATFTFCGVSCTWVSNTYSGHLLYKLSKSDFGFGTKYENLAKLYTYPYSVLQVADETGSITEIRIEDTHGTLNVEAAYSLVFPWIRLDAHIIGVGTAARKTLTWHDIGTRHADIAGNWYELLQSWNIPTFGITQSAAVVNDYSTHFDREQMSVQGATAQNDAIALANTSVANAALQVAANTTINTANVTKLNSEVAQNNSYQDQQTQTQAQYNTQSMNTQITLQEQQASIAQVTNTWSAASGALGSLLSFDIAGAIGSAVNGAVNAWATGASLAATVGYTQAATGASNLFNYLNMSQAVANDIALNGLVTTNETARTNAGNQLTTGTTANSAATQISNANRDKAANDSAILNQIRQAALNAPSEFGQFANGEHATTRPQGLFCNVVTQSKAAIVQAGDIFLRYGYRINRMIDFSTWHYGKHFTYWQASDMWTEGNTIPDKYADQLRYFILGGVTVWKKPEDIGHVTIYENM